MKPKPKETDKAKRVRLLTEWQEKLRGASDALVKASLSEADNPTRVRLFSATLHCLGLCSADLRMEQEG